MSQSPSANAATSPEHAHVTFMEDPNPASIDDAPPGFAHSLVRQPDSFHLPTAGRPAPHGGCHAAHHDAFAASVASAYAPSVDDASVVQWHRPAEGSMLAVHNSSIATHPFGRSTASMSTTAAYVAGCGDERRGSRGSSHASPPPTPLFAKRGQAPPSPASLRTMWAAEMAELEAGGSFDLDLPNYLDTPVDQLPPLPPPLLLPAAAVPRGARPDTSPMSLNGVSPASQET